MWWHTDLPVPTGTPAQSEAPPGAVPGEELLFVLDLDASEAASDLLALFGAAEPDASPFVRLPTERKSD